MAQRIDPDSDVATGLWTVTPLWSKIDDGAIADDTDLVTSVALVAVDDTDSFEVTLSNPASAPGSGTNTVTFRARKTGSSTVTMTVDCLESGVSKGSLAQALTTILTTYTFNPTGIGNYNNLNITVLVSNDIAGANTVQVTWIKMDVPDASAGQLESCQGNSDIQSALSNTLRIAHREIGNIDSLSIASEGMRAGKRVIIDIDSISSAILSLPVGKSIGVNINQLLEIYSNLILGKGIASLIDSQLNLSTDLRVGKNVRSEIESVLYLDVALKNGKNIGVNISGNCESWLSISTANILQCSIDVLSSVFLSVQSGRSINSIIDLLSNAQFSLSSSKKLNGQIDLQLICTLSPLLAQLSHNDFNWRFEYRDGFIVAIDDSGTSGDFKNKDNYFIN